MNKPALIVLTSALALFTSSAHAANSVVIESRTFRAGETACTIGVFVTNDDSIKGIILPFELRTVSGGAYFAGLTGPPSSFLTMQPGRRLHASPIGSEHPQGQWPPPSTVTWLFETPDIQACSGPMSQSWRVVTPTLSGSSPDGIRFHTYSIGDPSIEPVTLAAGADPPMRDSASLIFIFDANDSVGCFEIDTACMAPVAHLYFHLIDDNLIGVGFVRGTICLTPCDCDCHTNPANCASPDINVLDVELVVKVALRAGADIPDPNPDCPRVTTDLDCDGTTTIIDVIKMIDVAFRAANPATTFCNPCS